MVRVCVGGVREEGVCVCVHTVLNGYLEVFFSTEIEYGGMEGSSTPRDRREEATAVAAHPSFISAPLLPPFASLEPDGMTNNARWTPRQHL